MVLLSFLEIRKVDGKDASKWAILAYFPFQVWGAAALFFIGNPFQKRHAKFALLLDAAILVWAFIMFIFSNTWMDVDSNTPQELYIFVSGFFVIGLLVWILYYFYAMYLSLTARYVKVENIID